MKTLSKSTQRGYSLIELSIALAIIGVVIAGSIVGVQAILTSNNVNKTIKQTNNAVGKVISKFVRDSDWSKVTTETLSKVGFDVWNDTEVQNAGTSSAVVTHPLGGKVVVKPVVQGSTTASNSYGIDSNQGLVYTLTGVPVRGCSDLAAGLEGLAVALSVKNENAASATPAGNLDKNQVVVDNTPGGTRFNADNVNDKCNGGGVSGAVGTATIAILVQRR